MANIEILTGVKEYTLNDKVTVRFNPTDMTFAEKIFATFMDLDKVQEGLRAKLDATDGMGIFEVAKEADRQMRERIDALFDKPICEDLIGGVNIYALASGLPIWANLLLALMEEVDASFINEQKAQNPRLQKYLKKYNKGAV